ncbi:MAG: MATE family efflux transporter [Pseudoramibacter sp.]|jgi:putative MATE family efflux protein
MEKAAADNQSDFTQGGIAGKLLKFMIPVFGALVLQAMYGAVDLLVVGRFGSRAGLSGVSTGSNILNLVTIVVTALAMGVTVVIGHDLGERRPDRISPLLGGSTLVFGGIAAALCLVMTLFARPIATLMMAPKEALALTAQYVRICGAGIFFVVAYNVIAAVFRGLGDSKTPLIFVAVACVCNVVGDLLFVAVFHMNVAGAALATIMAQGISVVLSLIIMFKRDLPFTLHKKDFRLNSEVRRFLRIGLPMSFQEFLTQISFLVICALVNRLGLAASSGYGVASKLISFIMLVPSSLTQSMAAFISQNVSAGKEDRARKAMVTGMVFGASVGVVIFILVWFFGGAASSLFTTRQAFIQKSWDYLKGFGPEAIVTSFLFSFYGYFNGHDRSTFVMILGMLQTFIVRLPMSYFMSIQPHASLTHIGLACPVSTLFGVIIALIYYLHMLRQMKKGIKTHPAS